ncbi:MAG TPA: PQQ-dependent sugar dehydrogenase, partial [Terriglobales bacterium]|nr:PQQ-dependent sugar dehydrogenase [Terriglobales bacterium]
IPRHLTILSLALVAVAQAQAPSSPQPGPLPLPAKVTTVATGLEHPWSIALLPNGEMLVSERKGRLRRVSADGKLSPPLGGVPAVQSKSQAGLLDITLSPSFGSDQTLYLSFSEPDPTAAGTAVLRAELGADELTEAKVIWSQQPKVAGPNHWGSRLLFAPDGNLFVTLGDRFDYKEKAQDLGTTLGKIVRLKPDGSIPSDNPFHDRSGARPEIWSYGHRNIQAAAIHPQTGELWTVEHGARGGDELNQPRAGKNYGWPVITYGIDYSGAKIGEGTAKEGMEQPVYYWDPVIAPSGAIFYRGEAFPDWRGSLLIGSLKPGGLVRLTFDGKQVRSEERYAGELATRIRDIAEASDGTIYVVTDEREGRILRLEPR